MPGTLFVVATPIGNLEDLTFRALRVLRESDLIAAEDTRRTAKLLAHYEIRKSMVSLHEHNEHRETPRLIERIKAGEAVALVSDAGTPGISDPGSKLVAAAHQAGIRVVPIPGPSAVTAALSVAGIDASTFVFLGFPPSSGAARSKWLERLTSEVAPVVFFEAPHRIRRTLDELATRVERPISVHREITKIHEQLVFSPTTTKVSDRGEFVVVVGPRSEAVHSAPETIEPEKVLAFATSLTESGLATEEQVSSIVAKALDLHERDVKKLIKRGRYSVKRQS